VIADCSKLRSTLELREQRVTDLESQLSGCQQQLILVERKLDRLRAKGTTLYVAGTSSTAQGEATGSSSGGLASATDVRYVQ